MACEAGGKDWSGVSISLGKLRITGSHQKLEKGIEHSERACF